MDDDRSSNPPEESSQSRRVLYCAGCNERFRNLTKSAVCPRCGAAARTAPDMAFAETMVISDLSSSFNQNTDGHGCPTTPEGGNQQAKKVPQSEECHELDELIGQSLLLGRALQRLCQDKRLLYRQMTKQVIGIYLPNPSGEWLFDSPPALPSRNCA